MGEDSDGESREIARMQREAQFTLASVAKLDEEIARIKAKSVNFSNHTQATGESSSIMKNKDELGSSNTGDNQKMPKFDDLKSRVCSYGARASAPFIVYVRAKEKKSLNAISVSDDLFKDFNSIKKINPVRNDKLMVEFSNRIQANELPKNKKYTDKFHVYIPSLLSEVDGKIKLDPEMGDTKSVYERGYGMLNNSNEQIKIVDVFRLQTRRENEEMAVDTPIVRVTFEGSVLPDYLIINRLRIRVDPYIPRVMRCKNCLRTGHTEKFCGNRARCGTCGEIHDSATECVTNAFKCPNCENIYPNPTHTCPKIDSIRRARVSEILKIREEKRTGSGNVRSSDRTRRVEEFPALPVRNSYGVLHVEGGDTQEDSTGAQAMEYESENTNSNTRKRKLSQGEDVTESYWFSWAKDYDRESERQNQEKPTDLRTQNQKNSSVSGGARRKQKENSVNSGSWKEIILNWLGKMGISPLLISFVEGVIMPWVEKHLGSLVANMFGFMSGSFNDGQ
ncbi:hypothetical protein DMENIID0001_143180 [Sergentomyia squamirostris]